VSDFYCAPCGAYAPEDCAHENQLKTIVDLTAERDRYRKALEKLAGRTIGGMRPWTAQVAQKALDGDRSQGRA
jgi:hypothetical protein